ncbi:MAG TPA: MerR family transcriptional regulator [Acidimicrobiales bacterium]|nr:MerR family transcriptional regulator [Acidimicrobiales bacterium]
MDLPVAPERTGSRPGVAEWVTVDDAARATGTTTRQVRALQTRGLLPHPHLVGRTGYYDDGHLDRLRAVLRLQDSGFSLVAIASLVRAWEAGMTLAQLLGLPPGRPDVTDEPDIFDGYRAPWRGRLLSVVPTTLLDEPAAS